VLEFLRETDPALLKRISRKLINHLSWGGVEEAKELLRSGVATLPREPGLATDGNRPLPQDAPGHSSDLTTQALRIAGEHLSETEILNCVTRWIKENKASFLVRALENQDTSLGEVMECVERYRHIGVEEDELSLYTQKGLRVSLIRRFFSESLDLSTSLRGSSTLRISMICWVRSSTRPPVTGSWAVRVPVCSWPRRS
jgi:hypothetical protein